MLAGAPGQARWQQGRDQRAPEPGGGHTGPLAASRVALAGSQRPAEVPAGTARGGAGRLAAEFVDSRMSTFFPILEEAESLMAKLEARCQSQTEEIQELL